jgi:hypothetical protein
MNKISKKSVGVSIIGIALLLSANPALGREGRGGSFMRAFGMTANSDGFVSSYQDWSHRLSSMTGETGSVGPVLAQGDPDGFGERFRLFFASGGGGGRAGLSSLLSFGNSQTILGVSVFTPYSYQYRGYR